MICDQSDLLLDHCFIINYQLIYKALIFGICTINYRPYMKGRFFYSIINYV